MQRVRVRFVLRTWGQGTPKIRRSLAHNTPSPYFVVISSISNHGLEIICVLEIPRLGNVALANSMPKICVLRWVNGQAQRPNRTSRGAKEAAK